MSTNDTPRADTEVERIRSHVRDRVAAFDRGDLNAASEAHGRWYRAYTDAPESVRERYWATASRQRESR